MAFDPPHVPTPVAHDLRWYAVGALLRAAGEAPTIQGAKGLLAETIDILGGDRPAGERGSQREG